MRGVGRRQWGAVLVVAVVLAACGGSGTTDATSDDEPPIAVLRPETSATLPEPSSTLATVPAVTVAPFEEEAAPSAPTVPQPLDPTATLPVPTLAPPATDGAVAPVVPPPPGGVSEEVAKTFVDMLALDGPVRRWAKGTVTLSWFGVPTQEDRDILGQQLFWLALVPGVPRLELLADGSPADVELHASPKDQWSVIFGGGESGAEVYGYTQTEWVQGRGLRRAVVAVDSLAPQSLRNRTIGHELYHALGHGHHTCRGGLMYGGGNGDLRWLPSTFDVELLEVLYRPDVPQGAGADSALAAVPVGGTDPTCPAPQFSAVRAPDGTALWCEVTPDPRRCHVPLPGVQPTPGAEPAFWIAGGLLTVYDPSRFVAFRTTGGEVLCEIPRPLERVPCQEGVDLRQVERADLWTDGLQLFESPT
jgi:hypothetical protein